MVLCLHLFPLLQSGYNTRIKAIHILNTPPYADLLINMFKAAMKSKLAKRVCTNLLFSWIFSRIFCYITLHLCFSYSLQGFPDFILWLLDCKKLKVPLTGPKSQRGRVLARLFLDLGATTGGWSAPRPCRLTTGKDSVPILQGTAWAPGPVWMCVKNLAPTGIRSPDHTARSQSLYRLI
jgi:hypothetical protein